MKSTVVRGSTPPEAAIRRAAAISRAQRVLPPLIAGAVMLALWQFVGARMNPILFAPPTRVVDALWSMTMDGQLPRAMLVTLNTLFVGMLLSIVVGIPTGVVLGRNRLLARLTEPYINAIYATPRVVVVPLVILWFGIGYSGRLFIVWLGAVIPIIVNTTIGVRQSRPDLVEVARSFGLSERQLAWHVLIPGSVPYVAAGVRVAVGRALIGVVIGEIFLEVTGVGGIIQISSGFLRTPSMLAGVVTMSLLGMILLGAFDRFERRFETWKE